MIIMLIRLSSMHPTALRLLWATLRQMRRSSSTTTTRWERKRFRFVVCGDCGQGGSNTCFFLCRTMQCQSCETTLGWSTLTGAFQTASRSTIWSGWVVILIIVAAIIFMSITTIMGSMILIIIMIVITRWARVVRFVCSSIGLRLRSSSTMGFMPWPPGGDDHDDHFDHDKVAGNDLSLEEIFKDSLW